MAGKARVHELAKELGVTSKQILSKLNDLGEFVKSPSSTVEPPVVRKLREAFPAPEPKVEVAPAAASAGAGPRSETPAKKFASGAPKASPASLQRALAQQNDNAVAQQKIAERAAEFEAAKLTMAASELAAAERAANEQTQSELETQAPSGETPAPSPARSPAAPRNPFLSGAQSASRSGSGGAAGPRPSPSQMPVSRPSGPPDRGGRGGPGAARPGGDRSGRPDRGRTGSGGGGYRGGGAPGGASSGAPGGAPGGGYRGGPGTPGGGASAGGAGGGGRPGGGGRGRSGSYGGGFGRGGSKSKARKSRAQRKQEFDNLAAPTMSSGAPRGNGEVVRLPRGASLSDFADKINANPGSLVQETFGLGEMVTATQSCTDETLQLLGVHLGYEVSIVSPEDEDRELLARFDIDIDAETDDELVTRPPVVSVMGHVDHGKTKLLDAIRDTKVAEREAGGITQHIGAYQVQVPHGGSDRAITFIDTPGHEAFTAMRARGAQATDIVILVVAADDGVKPQTIEALNHAKAANVPMVVAVNKIDKEGASPDKVRQQLTEYGLIAEEYGGDTMFIDISAKARTNIDGLLEAVLLTADAALDLRAPASSPAQGIAIEGHLDRGRGPVATVLVQSGTLRIGDAIVAGEAHGRVRAMLNDRGGQITTAGPAFPVQVLGLTAVPRAGDKFLTVSEDRIARQIAEQRQARERNAQQAANRGRPTLESVLERMAEGDKSQLNLILKGDVSGSVEALEDALVKIDVGSDVSLRVLHRGVGAITQNDVNLARGDNAVIIGFNVRPAERVAELADREGVDIRYYSVIYAAIDDIEAALTGMLKPEFEEVQLGSAEIREVFRSSKFGNIAGCIVRSGEIRRNSKARLVRDGTVVGDNLSIDSLRRFTDDATEVREGFECGIGLGSFNDIKIGDVIETFQIREKPRS